MGRLMAARPLAVVLASADLERLYTGLSLLVSAAAEGRSARGLVTFGALAVLADPALGDRALDPVETPHLTERGRATFARSILELRALAAPSLHACAAAVETTGLGADGLAGVVSTPRFLAEAGEAELVVV
jgi:peroxiredoxin family protein